MNTPSEECGIVRQLISKHVPEVASGVIEIKDIAREPGVLSVVVVHSAQPCDAVGTFIGPKGSRVREMGNELKPEFISVVRWSDSVEDFIRNLLQGFTDCSLLQVSLDDAAHRATVTLRPKPAPFQMQTAREKNETRQEATKRLAARLSGWEIALDVQPHSTWSRMVAEMSVKKLAAQGLVAQGDFDHAVGVIAQEILVRLSVGDYPTR